MVETLKKKQKLLITIVNKGLGSKVVKASRRMGCDGGTILPGTGTGVHEGSTFFGFKIDPEKEVIFSVVNEDEIETVANAVSKAAKLGKPGNGICFIVNIGTVAGIAHLLEEQSKSSRK